MIDRRRLVLGSASTLLLSLAPWQIARGARMVDVRMWPAEEYTRVTLEYDSPLNFKYFFVRSSKPLRLVVDIKGLELTVALQKQIAAVKPDDPYIAAMRIGQFQPDTVRLVMDLKTNVKPEVFQLQPFAARLGRRSRLGHQPGSQQHPAEGKRRQKPPSFLHPMSHRVVFPPVIRFAVWIRCRTHVIFQYKFSHLQLILHAGEARVKFFGANVTNSTWLLVSSPKVILLFCAKRDRRTFPDAAAVAGTCRNEKIA